MTEENGNLEAYVDLALMLGPRSTEAERVNRTGQFFSMAGEGEGGQLSSAMRKLYFPDGPSPAAGPAPLKKGERLSVYWTDLNEWYEGTFITSRVEDADGGGKQRASCIVYDAVGPWAQCTKADLTYWHCLDDEQWEAAE